MTAIMELDLVAITDPLAPPMKYETTRGDAFTDLDRRTIANLSIPRNVYDLQHRLRIDRYTPTRSEAGVHEHLLNLKDRGLACNLGEHTDMAKLAHAVERHSQALTMPDDKASIFARRLSVPDRRWRVEGDVWMLTYEGLEAIKAPPLNTPGPMVPSRVEAAIVYEHGRVDWEYDPETATIHSLHPVEYLAWLQQVVAECERVWGVKPHVPSNRFKMAGGASGWSDFYENAILDHENQKTSLATPDAITTPWFMALSILAFTDADTGVTADNGSHIPTYTGWGRKSVPAADMAVSAAGSSANTVAIQFAACTSNTSTILGFANCRLVTVGDLRKWGDCASTVISTTQTPAQFAIGAYVTTAN